MKYGRIIVNIDINAVIINPKIIFVLLSLSEIPLKSNKKIKIKNKINTMVIKTVDLPTILLLS